MRRPGNGLVMLGRRQHHGHRAADLDQRGNPPYGRGRGAVVPADRPRASGEQVRGGSEWSGALAAGHRVAADITRRGRVTGHLHQRRRLHAAHVGDDRVVPGRVERSRDGLAEMVGRHRHHHQHRLVTGLLRAPGSQPRRGAQMLGGRVRQEYVDARPSAGERDRGTDQAGTDHLDRAGQEATRRGVHRHAARLGDRRPERPGPTVTRAGRTRTTSGCPRGRARCRHGRRSPGPPSVAARLPRPRPRRRRRRPDRP